MVSGNDLGPPRDDVEVITDPVKIQQIEALWAEIQTNPVEPDDVDALLAKVRGSASEDDEEIRIRPCVCWGEGCQQCEDTGVIYP